MGDPEKEQEKEQEQGKQEQEKEKEQGKQEQEKEQVSSDFITLKSASGNSYNVKVNELLELSTYAINQLEKRQTEPTNNKEVKGKEEEVIEKDSNERIAILEKQIKDLEEKQESEKRQVSIHNEINTIRDKFDITKDNEKLHKKLAALSAIQHELNPRISLTEFYSKEVKDIMEMFEEHGKIKNKNRMVENAISGVNRGGGNVPFIDVKKKFTGDDFKKGKSREEMRKFMESLMESE